MEEIRPPRHALLKEIEQCIRKTGYDENFIKSAFFHLNVDFSYQSKEFVSRLQMCDALMSRLFIGKVNMYPTKRFICEVNENSDWPVPILPSDVFCETKLPDTYRIACFHKFLKIGDVLECRVASILPSYFCLRVIHKDGTARILDDLNIVVRLPRDKSNMEILKKELLTCELIRVAVSKFSKEEQEEIIHVTVDEKSLECGISLNNRDNLKNLGRMTEDDVPSYVLDPPDPEKYASYSNYLSSMPQFQNPIRLNEIFVGLGVDPKRVYSYYPSYDRLTVSEENTGQALLKKSKSNDVKKFIQLSINECKKRNFPEALKWINMALDFCPKDDPLKSVLYQYRGDTYFKDTKNLKNVKNAVFDWITAYYLDPSNDSPSKKYLSIVFFQIANGYYRCKEYRKAVTYAETSLDLNKKNCDAENLLGYLKMNHQESFSSYDEKTLAELQQKKKKLVSKLNKLK